MAAWLKVTAARDNSCVGAPVWMAVKNTGKKSRVGGGESEKRKAALQVAENAALQGECHGGMGQ